MPPEIIITLGTYKWRAVLIDKEQPLSWLCQEFFNVGLETESQGNSYADSITHVLGTASRLIAESVMQ
jgi:uracil-DNA glycosylase